MKRFALLTAAVVALAAVPMLAQQPPQGPGQGHGRMGMGPGGPGGADMMGIGPMLHALNLTDAQREQVHALLQENRAEDPPKIMELQHKLHTALINGDTASLDQLKADLNAAHAAQLDAHIALMQKVLQILTPEQKQQLLNMAPPGSGRGRGKQ